MHNQYELARVGLLKVEEGDFSFLFGIKKTMVKSLDAIARIICEMRRGAGGKKNSRMLLQS